MKIRKASKKDIDEIVDMAYEFELYLIGLDDSLVQESPSKNIFKKFLIAGFDDPKHYFIVAEDAGRLVGFADLWTYPEFLHGGISAYLHNLFVRESVRGTGIGKTMVDALVKEAGARGAVAIHVPVKAKNKKAIEFYKKCGINEQLAMMEARLDR
jgi:GNAT superfamily N-acetyltransferase